MNVTGLWAQYRDEAIERPVPGAGALGGPGRAGDDAAGRSRFWAGSNGSRPGAGRIMQRPEFSSIVVGMMLVMGNPGHLRGAGAQEPDV